MRRCLENFNSFLWSIMMCPMCLQLLLDIRVSWVLSVMSCEEIIIRGKEDKTIIKLFVLICQVKAQFREKQVWL